MRKTWIALLAALVMALGLVCGAAAQTAVDLEAAIQGKWDLNTITGLDSTGAENADDESVAAAMAMIKAMGGSITMEFANGKCVMEMSILGQSQSEETDYVFNGDQMTLGASVMDVGVDGDTLYLTTDGVTMVMVRVGAEAQTGTEKDAGPAEGLLGVWLITDVVAEDADSDTLPARIKPTFDNGDELKMTFTADKVSIAMNGEDVEETDYAADAETILIGTDISANYIIDAEGKLYFVEGDDRIVMTFAEALPAPKAEIPEGGYTLEGSWKATGAEGDTEDADSFRQMIEMGATITMTFENGTASIKIEFMGQEQETELGHYELQDGALVMNGVPTYYTIEGDTLKMEEEDVLLTLVRVTD